MAITGNSRDPRDKLRPYRDDGWLPGPGEEINAYPCEM